MPGLGWVGLHRSPASLRIISAQPQQLTLPPVHLPASCPTPPRRNAVVLPAFETQDDGEEGRRIALEAVRMGKPYVAHKFE